MYIRLYKYGEEVEEVLIPYTFYNNTKHYSMEGLGYTVKWFSKPQKVNISNKKVVPSYNLFKKLDTPLNTWFKDGEYIFCVKKFDSFSKLFLYGFKYNYIFVSPQRVWIWDADDADWGYSGDTSGVAEIISQMKEVNLKYLEYFLEKKGCVRT